MRHKRITERHRKAARLLCEGKSAYRALTEAGFSRWTARNFTQILCRSWLLREAIREEQEQHGIYLNKPSPKRRKRWDRQPMALAVTNYVNSVPEDNDARLVPQLYRDSKHAEKLNKQERGELPRQPERRSYGNSCPSCGQHSPGGFMCQRCCGF